MGEIFSKFEIITDPNHEVILIETHIPPKYGLSKLYSDGEFSYVINNSTNPFFTSQDSFQIKVFDGVQIAYGNVILNLSSPPGVGTEIQIQSNNSLSNPWTIEGLEEYSYNIIIKDQKLKQDLLEYELIKSPSFGVSGLQRISSTELTQNSGLIKDDTINFIWKHPITNQTRFHEPLCIKVKNHTAETISYWFECIRIINSNNTNSWE